MSRHHHHHHHHHHHWRLHKKKVAPLANTTLAFHSCVVGSAGFFISEGYQLTFWLTMMPGILGLPAVAGKKFFPCRRNS